MNKEQTNAIETYVRLTAAFLSAGTSRTRDDDAAHLMLRARGRACAVMTHDSIHLAGVIGNMLTDSVLTAQQEERNRVREMMK